VDTNFPEEHNSIQLCCNIRSKQKDLNLQSWYFYEDNMTLFHHILTFSFFCFNGHFNKKNSWSGHGFTTIPCDCELLFWTQWGLSTLQGNPQASLLIHGIFMTWEEKLKEFPNHTNSIYKHIHSTVSPSWLLKHTKHPRAQWTIQQKGTQPTLTFIQNADHNTAWQISRV